MLINLTPHTICIVADATYNPAIRKFVGGRIVKTIPSSGMVSANYRQSDLGLIDNDIPVVGKMVESIDPIPDFDGNNAYIVSGLYAAAAKELGLYTGSLYSPADMCVEEDGRTVRGCIGLVKQ